MTRSPWTRRARRFFLPLMRISACLVDLFEVEVAAVEEDLRVVFGDVGRPGSDESLPSARPMVVTALCTL